MSKDAKDSKHRPEGHRQPQRKDSFSSVLSWAGLQGRMTVPKASTTSSTTPQSLQNTSGNTNGTSRPRRHSHSTVNDIKKKARRGSTTFRAFSFSISTGTQKGASTKTRHTKTSSMSQDPKSPPGTSKTGKDGSLEKVNKAASDTTTPGKNTAQSQPLRSTPYQPRSPGSPVPMPKSILRVASPDGHKRPGNFANPDTVASASPGSPPSSPGFTSMAPDSPPGSPSGSPPMSPIQRPLSPGVRFAKATIHRVEVGPGRRFLPVKRKSKSTLTYISPLDPGTQKSAPKTMLQSPTKMRRHQENQAAMGRYWMRTEEEEAQWRAEAGRRAEQEAERYRNEPASRPANLAAKSPVEEAGMQNTLADKLPALDSKQSLDRVEEEVVEDSSDSDSDEEAGAKCNQEADRDKELETAENRGETREATDQKPEPAKPDTENPPTKDTQPAESKSFSERLAEQQAAEEREKRGASPPTAPRPGTPESYTSATKPSMNRLTRTISSGSDSSRSTSSTGSTSSTSSGGSSSSSAQRLTKSTYAPPSHPQPQPQSQHREREKGKEKPRAMNSKQGGSRTEKTPATTAARGGGTSHNHLHLRRGRRYFDHKQEITA